MQNTRTSQASGAVSQIPHFAFSVSKSPKDFHLSCANDVSKIWNDTPDNVRQVSLFF